MKITEVSINRPRAVTMVFLAVILFGLISLTNLPVNLFPDITLPMMLVMTTYPGAGPEEIEYHITDPLEKILGTVNRVDKITSETSENTSMIMVQFEWGTDLDAAANDVRDNLGMIQPYLPEDADLPLIFKLDISQQPVVMYNIVGDIDPRELDRISNDIEDRLQRVAGVAASYAMGHRMPEIQVTLDPIKLKNTGITVEQIKGVLEVQNLNYPLGSVESGRNVYILRLVGQYQNLDEIRNTVVGNKNGIPIYLSQVAEVRSDLEEATFIARTNGIPSAWGMVQKRTDANTVSVCDNVIKEIEHINKELPPGLKIEIMFNQARYIKRSVQSTANTLVLGAILAIIVLFLFLGNIKATLYVAVAIPITVFFALFAMYFFKMSLNILSLGGLTVAIGMVVDSAIVVFEAIFRHRENGVGAQEAASTGASEVGTAITASTLTTVAVFLPLLLISGFASIFFRQLALCVTFALIASLIVALTIIPMLTSRFLDVKSIKAETGIGDLFRRFYKKLEMVYGRIIEWALVHRLAVIMGTLIIFVVSLFLIPSIGMTFMPPMDQGEIYIDAEMPIGTRLAVTDSAVIKIEKQIIEAVPEAEVVSTNIGTGTGFQSLFGSTAGPHSSRINLWLVDREKRKRSVSEIMQDIRPLFNTVPGLNVNFAMETFESFFGGAPIEIKIKGYDLDEGKMLADKIIEELKDVEGLTDLKSSYIKGKPEFQLVIDRQKAANFGLTPYQVGSALRARIEGVVASQYRMGKNEYDIKVRFDEQFRNNLEKIRSMTITTPVGEIPLRNFVIDTIGVGPVTIEHSNTDRIITITGNNEGRDLNVVAADIQNKLKNMEIPPDFNVEMGGGFEQMQTTFRDFGFVILLAIILVYMIMVGQFESFKYPFVIMFTIPLALIGVLWMLLFSGTTINLQSLLGVLLLGGVVVNNAIVYITYTNQLRREENMELFEAVIQAGKIRLRPILMTALTTSFGLLPMALAIGAGNELRAPLARAVIGGLLVSTFLTLVFIPVLYTIFERKRKQTEEA